MCPYIDLRMEKLDLSLSIDTFCIQIQRLIPREGKMLPYFNIYSLGNIKIGWEKNLSVCYCWKDDYFSMF